MNILREKWKKEIGSPSYEFSDEPLKSIKKYELEEFDLEVYLQKNDTKTYQRVMIAIPKNLITPCPAVVVPFYYPEAMLGFNPETGEKVERFCEYPIMKDLVKRGYITISSDAYYLTYTNNTYDSENNKEMNLWREAGEKLRILNPAWSGIGKLVSDTSLLIDALNSDSRVDSARIGIAGHSLGGKMAFYTGCLDERIKVIVASDFGIKWEQSNWKDIWYWHDKVDEFIKRKMDHSELLEIASPKPFCLIAGEYDDETSYDLMCKAKGYENHREHLKIINHATGHEPPKWALEESYEFIDKWLMPKKL